LKCQELHNALLEIMIEGYDDGRSRSFFCRAAALLDAKTLKWSMRKAEEVRASETRDKAKALKGILEKAALREGIELRGHLRRR
jgi:hypothetical protein